MPGLDLPSIDIVGAAASLGVGGETVGGPEELPEALERALGLGCPYVLNVPVDPNVPKSLG